MVKCEMCNEHHWYSETYLVSMHSKIITLGDVTEFSHVNSVKMVYICHECFETMDKHGAFNDWFITVYPSESGKQQLVEHYKKQLNAMYENYIKNRSDK